MQELVMKQQFSLSFTKPVLSFPSSGIRSLSPSSISMHRFSFPIKHLNAPPHHKGSVKFRIQSRRTDVDHGPESQESNRKTRIVVELPENEETGLSHEENKLRWRFVSKVYGVLAAQVTFCAAVSIVVIFSPPIKAFFCGFHSVTAFCTGLSPFLLLWPLITYRKRKPLNLIMFGLFTVCTSVALGLGCARLNDKVVTQALLTTATTVLPITAYAIWGSINGQDFRYPGPFSFSCGVILTSIVYQLFFPLVNVSRTLLAGVVAIIFAGFLVYDRDELIKKHAGHEYLEASICVYADIIYLFHCTFHVLRLIVEFHLWFFGITR